MLIALLVLSRCKDKHKPIVISVATDDSCMWKDIQTYGLFSKLGLELHLELYLLLVHMDPDLCQIHCHPVLVMSQCSHATSCDLHA